MSDARVATRPNTVLFWTTPELDKDLHRLANEAKEQKLVDDPYFGVSTICHEVVSRYLPMYEDELKKRGVVIGKSDN